MSDQYMNPEGTKFLWDAIKQKFASLNGGEDSNIYSTEETRIGTWINGEPLYRKVVKTSITTINGQRDVNIYTFSDDVIVKKIEASIATSQYSIPYITSFPHVVLSLGTFYCMWIFYNTKTHNLTVRSNWSDNSYWEIEAVVEYTKTIDSESSVNLQDSQSDFSAPVTAPIVDDIILPEEGVDS